LKNERANVRISLDELGLEGKQLFRDLWRQRDIGVFKRYFRADIPAHGVAMVRIRART